MTPKSGCMERKTPRVTDPDTWKDKALEVGVMAVFVVVVICIMRGCLLR